MKNGELDNIKGTIQDGLNNSSPFNKNLIHINYADNSIVKKLPPVEYEFDFGCYDYGSEPTVEIENEDLIMTDLYQDLLYT